MRRLPLVALVAAIAAAFSADAEARQDRRSYVATQGVNQTTVISSACGTMEVGHACFPLTGTEILIETLAVEDATGQRVAGRWVMESAAGVPIAFGNFCNSFADMPVAPDARRLRVHLQSAAENVLFQNPGLNCPMQATTGTVSVLFR
jgi:hypothetical protein